MNHAQEAEQYIHGGQMTADPNCYLVAQVHATLALADAQNRTADELAGIREQARVANIIALSASKFMVGQSTVQPQGIFHEEDGRLVLSRAVVDALDMELGDTND